MQPGFTNSANPEKKKKKRAYDEPTRAGFASGVRMEFDWGQANLQPAPGRRIRIDKYQN